MIALLSLAAVLALVGTRSMSPCVYRKDFSTIAILDTKDDSTYTGSRLPELPELSQLLIAIPQTIQEGVFHSDRGALASTSDQPRYPKHATG